MVVVILNGCEESYNRSEHRYFAVLSMTKTLLPNLDIVTLSFKLNNMPTSLFKLFTTFFRIGLFTFGGGYAMIPLIESDVVERNRWVKKEEFVDLLAVAQAAPGVFAVNMSVFIGYRLRGVRGALAAAFGCVLPSVLIILTIALFFRQFRHIEVVNNVFKGIRPVVVALIAVPVFNVAKSAKVGWSMAWIPVLSALLIVAFGVSPVFVILVAGLAGYVWGKIRREKP